MCECEYASIHMFTHTHTYTHTCLTLIFIAIQGVWHLHVLTQHAGLQILVVFTVNRGWGIYNNRRSNTSKGWGFPKKGAPPIPHIILDQQAIWIGQCSHSVQSSNIGSSLGMWAWLVMSSSCWSCFGHTHRMCRPVPVCTL